MTRDDLDTALLAAHAVGDGSALVTLYSAAAENACDPGAACFYLTHAYVYALEKGDPRAAGLHRQLCARGREA